MEEPLLKATNDLKKEEEKASPENGSKPEVVVEPTVLTLKMDLLLDKKKIRELGNRQDIILYLLDTIIRFSDQFGGLAEALLKEARGEPRLIIPSRDFRKLS